MAKSDTRYTDPVLRRFSRAEAKRRMWDGLLSETYRLALPNQDDSATNTRGGKRDSEIFDGTAVRAVKWKRAKLHGDLFPPFRHWTHFLPDSLDDEDLEGEVSEVWSAFVETAERKFHKAIDRSNFHLEVPLALGDALISTGALLIQEGTPDDPLRFEAVPIAQVIPEESSDGTIRTVFRAFDVPGRDIAERWPDAKLPDEVQTRVEDDPDGVLRVIEATVWKPQIGRYEYVVILTDGEYRLVEREYRASPWVVFRMDKATGETMGRGPVLDARADIATANKTKELILKNASIAVTGIWQAEDDGVLNPANIKLVPGAIIPKAPGSEGLKPLEAPGKFDVSQLLLKDLQDGIEATIKGPSLPPVEAGSRTAYEIGERRSEQMAVDVPMSLRLLSELDYPLVMRCLAILMGPAMVGSPYAITPPLLGERRVRPVPVSPLIRYQDIAEAQARNQALLLAMQVDAETTFSIIDRERYIRDFLESHGFKPTHLRAVDVVDPAGNAAAVGPAVQASPVDNVALAPLFRLLNGMAAATGEEDGAAARFEGLSGRLSDLGEETR
ncbi:MAG: phage tail protein [Rhodospirillaceae bacterium]|nr:phage tail protein [Rhodospirillaceae bacterium]